MPFYPLLFLSAFGWFLVHLTPTCYFGDCPEILTAILTHGIPHPTGFPLYLLLTTGASLLGADAFWVNCVSALASAFSTVLFVEIASRLLQKDGPPASLWLKGGFAAIFLSSATLLLHSSMTRIYPLNLTLLLATLAWALAFPPRQPRSILGLGFTLGLACATHLLFLTAVVFLAIQFWDQKGLLLKNAPWGAVGFSWGASLYLWIPLVAHLHPVVDWGDPSQFHRLMDYLTQKSYDTKMDSRDLEGTAVFITYFLGWLSREWPLYLWIPAFFGFRHLFLQDRRLFWALAGLMYFNFLILFAYGNEKDLFIGYRYFLPLYFALALGMAAGLQLAFDRFRAPWAQRGILFFLVLGLLLFQAPRAPLAEATCTYDYALNLLKPIPTGSYQIIQGDNQVFPVAYAALAKHLRPDIQFLETNGFFFPRVKEERAQDPKQSIHDFFLKLYKESGNVIYLSGEKEESTADIVEPFGLGYRMTTAKNRKKLAAPPDPNQIFRLRHLDLGLTDPECEEILSEYPLLTAAHEIWAGDKTDADKNLLKAERVGAHSIHTQNNISALYSKLGELDRARFCLEKTLLLQPHLALAHLNLGILYAKMGKPDKAVPEALTALQLDPKNQEALDFYLRLKNGGRPPSKNPL
jgi:tetratricopeptide (TPR) repeat protein